MLMSVKWTTKEIERLSTLVENGESTEKIYLSFLGTRTKSAVDKACKRHLGKCILGKPVLKVAEEISGVSVESKSRVVLESLLSKNKPVSFEELCNLLSMSPAETRLVIDDAIRGGLSFSLSNDGYILRGFKEHNNYSSASSMNIRPINNRFKVGVISDTHAGSEHAKNAELKNCVEYMYNDCGIKTILHSGDFLDGNGVYKGQEAEVVAWGMDAQLDIAVNALPQLKGLKYYMIGGNHDYSFIKRGGGDPLVSICRLRSDIVNCGWFNKVLTINGVKFELHHPDSGGAYAISYHLQKSIDSTPGGKKPQILLCGHYHQLIWLFYRNIQAFYTMSFQGQSLYLKRKKLYPVIGGIILDIAVDESGGIIDFSPKIIPYYEGKMQLGVSE